jgi:VIT1/CCC1 family predicted Fe2+/Mn2+ transporter
MSATVDILLTGLAIALIVATYGLTHRGDPWSWAARVLVVLLGASVAALVAEVWRVVA